MMLFPNLAPEKSREGLCTSPGWEWEPPLGAGHRCAPALLLQPHGVTRQSSGPSRRGYHMEPSAFGKGSREPARALGTLVLGYFPLERGHSRSPTALQLLDGLSQTLLCHMCLGGSVHAGAATAAQSPTIPSPPSREQNPTAGLL